MHIVLSSNSCGHPYTNDHTHSMVQLHTMYAADQDIPVSGRGEIRTPLSTTVEGR